jgi:hypothetical protein
MQITKFEQVDGIAARNIRQALGRSQEQFWGAIGVKREAGSSYEKRGRIPEPVQRLVFMRYVAGIPVDSAPALMRVGRIASSKSGAVSNIREASERIRTASIQLRAAEKAVNEEIDNG